MTETSPLFMRSVLVVVLVLAGSAGAQALTVTRCNVMKDGVFRPALIVDQGGQKTVFHIGEDGLTRSTIFDAGKAVAWAEAKFGVEAGSATVYKLCAGLVGGEGRSWTPKGDDGDDGGNPGSFG